MARNRIGLQLKGFDDLIANLEAANVSTKSAVDKALKASKQYVNEQLTKDTTNSNFPAHGKYSTGQLKSSIDRDFNVSWVGTTAELKIGYDFSKSGLTSVFLMYGTPRMAKAQKLYDDVYGNKIQRQIAKIQEEALNEIVRRAQGG